MCKPADMETIQYLMDSKKDKEFLHIGIHWAKKKGTGVPPKLKNVH